MGSKFSWPSPLHVFRPGARIRARERHGPKQQVLLSGPNFADNTIRPHYYTLTPIMPHWVGKLASCGLASAPACSKSVHFQRRDAALPEDLIKARPRKHVHVCIATHQRPTGVDIHHQVESNLASIHACVLCKPSETPCHSLDNLPCRHQALRLTSGPYPVVAIQPLVSLFRTSG